MPDWTASMTRTYEYYTVDPGTWKDVRKLNTVISCSIDRDSSADTLGSASFDIKELIGECYVRVYLITLQNGVKERHPLGTFLVQTPTASHDGKVQNVTVDAYTPLLELKENPPPLGYSLLKGDNIMDKAYLIVRDNVRAPVIPVNDNSTLQYDFVSDPNEKWINYTKDLIANAKYNLDLDELGRVLFAPKQDIAALQPVWEYTDGNSSILYPEISISRDLYGVPNVVEVVYSNGPDTYYAKVVNDDPNSPISTVNRGREIIYRETSPNFSGGDPTQYMIDEYANRLLRDLSALEVTIGYSHGYCPARVGDCVRLNCEKAGLLNVKAKVISQSIKCDASCSVSEKAVITTNLWR